MLAWSPLNHSKDVLGKIMICLSFLHSVSNYTYEGGKSRGRVSIKGHRRLFNDKIFHRILGKTLTFLELRALEQPKRHPRIISRANIKRKVINAGQIITPSRLEAVGAVWGLESPSDRASETGRSTVPPKATD